MNYVLKGSLWLLLALAGLWMVLYDIEEGLILIIIGAAAYFITTYEGERKKELKELNKKVKTQ